MRPTDVNPRFTRRNQRDPDETAERYTQNRRVTRRGQRVRQADRERLIVQSVTVHEDH